MFLAPARPTIHQSFSMFCRGRHSHSSPSLFVPMKYLGPESRAARERPPLRGYFHGFRAP
jgi:hypothetical protein